MAPAGLLEHAGIPHLTTVEWQALHDLAVVSGKIVVTSQQSTLTPDQHRVAIQDYMMHELTEACLRVLTPSSISHHDAIKMETSDGPDCLPLNYWFCEADIAAVK